MQSVKQIQDDIRVRYSDLIEAEYPRFSDAEMSRRQAVMADIVSAQQLDALIVVEAMRAGTATGWITGWPVTAEAVTLILPGARCRLFIQHFNHLPLARQLAWNAEVLWADVSATQRAADAIARATTGSARVGVIGRLDNRNRAQNGGKPAIEPNKQKSIGIVEVRPFRRPSSEHIDLLPQHQDFRFQLCSRLEERSQDAQNKFE
jgi:hypothetical protein